MLIGTNPKKMGIAVSDVYATLSTLLGSSYVNDFNIYGRNFRVMAQADTSFRTSLSDLGKYYVRNSSGGMVPLSSLVTSNVIEAPTLISHFNISAFDRNKRLSQTRLQQRASPGCIERSGGEIITGRLMDMNLPE